MKTLPGIVLAAATAAIAGLLTAPAATAGPADTIDPIAPRLGTWGSVAAAYRPPGCTDTSCLLALDITTSMIDSTAHCSVDQRTGSRIDNYTGDLTNGTYTRYAVASNYPTVDASVYCTDKWGHPYPVTIHMDLPLHGNLSDDMASKPAPN